MKPKHEKLQQFFSDEEFIVHLLKQDGKQCAEVEKWTNGGVDMNITLVPFKKEKFIEYVENFDVDEEIDNHRQDKRYKDAFKISESVTDFTDFQTMLEEVAEKLNNII